MIGAALAVTGLVITGGGLTAAGIVVALLGMGVDIGVQVNSNSGIPELNVIGLDCVDPTQKLRTYKESRKKKEKEE